MLRYLLVICFVPPLLVAPGFAQSAAPSQSATPSRVEAAMSTPRGALTPFLVSSQDASLNWNLRCDVREEMFTWLGGLDGGRYLPRRRLDVEPAEAASHHG